MMISLFQAIIVFILLGLGTFYYFKTRSSPETPKSDDFDSLKDIKPVKTAPTVTDEPESDDFDPLEDVEAELDIKPAKTTPAVADEPDENVEPEINISYSFIEKVPDTPVQPTVTSTPAQSLIPGKAGTNVSVNRSLTNVESVRFENKIKRHFIKNSTECDAIMNARLIMSFVRGRSFSAEQIKKMTEPDREEFKTDDTPNGFVPMIVMKDYGMTMNSGGSREIMQRCTRR